MAVTGGFLKRLLVGRPLRSNRLGEQALPKKLALPIFSSDAMSSVAYATEEILIVLAAGGFSYYHFTPYVAAGVVALMAAVVFSYRKTVHAYPSGGGDYEVASVNFGRAPGLTVASALMTDYVVTVAVSVAAGVAAITSAVPSLYGDRVLIAVLLVVLITSLNLRGIRESGKTFAVPTYGFILAVFALIAVGIVRFLASGNVPQAESAGYHIAPTTGGIAGFTFVFLLLRAFASGCTALTGVEAIANGVPSFKTPKSANAARTLLLMGVIAVTMFVGITIFALASNVHATTDPSRLIGLPAGASEKTVLAQVGAAIFGGGSIGFYFLQVVTAAILVLAANTAFNGFPVLASILARDRFLPRQLHTRGDRLVYSNGILLLAGFAVVLIVVFGASTTRLINLYIIGVFISFTISQFGMVRHWGRRLRTEPELSRAERRDMQRSRVVQGFGGCFAGLVLVIELITKFLAGAWIAVVAIGLLFVLMRGINRHYQRVGDDLDVGEDETTMLPSRVHAVVLVSRLHKPAVRALAVARATRPSTLTAVTVTVDDEETHALQDEWERREIPIPLLALDSPYREVTRPVLDYVKKIRRQSPRDVVIVYIPEYVVGHWWEQLLHNQSALRLKSRLLFQPGVMVTSVPYQLRSSIGQAGPERAPSNGGATGGGGLGSAPSSPPVGGPGGDGRDGAGQ